MPTSARIHGYAASGEGRSVWGPRVSSWIDQPRERRDQQEHGPEPQPHDARERALAAGGGWPAQSGEGNEQRQHRREPDDDVHRSARPVAHQHEHEGERPERGQDAGEDPQLDDPDAHGGESSGGPLRVWPGPLTRIAGPCSRTHHRKYRHP